MTPQIKRMTWQNSRPATGKNKNARMYKMYVTASTFVSNKSFYIRGMLHSIPGKKQALNKFPCFQ